MVAEEKNVTKNTCRGYGRPEVNRQTDILTKTVTPDENYMPPHPYLSTRGGGGGGGGGPAAREEEGERERERHKYSGLNK